MENYKYLQMVCRNILNGKFNDEKYRYGKNYYGREIQTQPLFTSYGIIGFTLTIENQTEIQYDGEMRELTIDDKPYKFYINEEYLSDNDIQIISTGLWNDEPNSVELETYTDGGEDMILSLHDCTKAELESYIEDFDINDNVMMWWRDGEDAAHKAGVPFTNIKDHYEDYEDYLKWLKKVAKLMPY